MNFQALEGLIQSIVSGYNCTECNCKLQKKDVNIKSIEENSAILELVCPECGNVSLIQSEVLSMDVTKLLTKEQLAELQKGMEGLAKAKSIRDEQIVELNKNLKKENFEVSDLFL